MTRLTGARPLTVRAVFTNTQRAKLERTPKWWTGIRSMIMISRVFSHTHVQIHNHSYRCSVYDVCAKTVCVCIYIYIYIYFLVSAERAQTWFLNTFPIKGGPEEIQLITRMWQREDKVIPKLLIVLQNKEVLKD